MATGKYSLSGFTPGKNLQASSSGELATNIESFDAKMVRAWVVSQQMRKAVQGGISPHTLRAYEFESNRFVGFLMQRWGDSFNQGDYLKNVTEEDAHEYVHYLFSNNLSPASVKRSLTIINSLFKHIHNKGVITVQPFANVGVSLPSSVGTNMEDKELTPSELEIVFTACENLPRHTPRLNTIYYRTRWLVNLLFRGWQRRSEVASLKMSDIYYSNASKGWEIKFVGKGNKLRVIVATDELMQELEIYRKFIGLSPTPSASETNIPVLGSIADPFVPMKQAQVYFSVKRIFEIAIRSLSPDNPDTERLREKFSKCAVHTFRHTGISDYVNNEGDLHSAQIQAGHTNGSSTMVYVHKNRTNLRNEISKKQGRGQHGSEN